MPISPKNPSALLRSLGPDESAMEAKLRVSAREAEQRWPLFRALAPTKAAPLPPMSDADKQAWEQAAAPATATRKPLLTRPGLSGKLSSGLEKFATAALNTKRNPNSTPYSTPTGKDAPAASAIRANTKAQTTPRTPAENGGTSSLFGAAQPDMPRKTLFPPTAPVQPVGRLFAGRSAQQTTQRTTATSSAKFPAGHEVTPARPLQPQASDSLAAIFDRVEGKAPTAPAAPGGRLNSVMHRIGKR